MENIYLKMKRYKQTTYESCLACCLLEAVKDTRPLKINQKLELDCINHSMKFSKDDFVIGHLDFIFKKFKIPVVRIIDSIQVYNTIQSLRFSRKIKTSVKKVNLKLIDQYIDRQPIIAVDFYHFYKVFPFHYPHFIMILAKEGSRYKIYDPWFGIERHIDGEALGGAINSLKDYIRFSPEIISLDVNHKKKDMPHLHFKLFDKLKKSVK
jgi:hypothetical protein